MFNSQMNPNPNPNPNPSTVLVLAAAKVAALLPDQSGACTAAAMRSGQLALDKNSRGGGKLFVLSPNSPSIGCPKIKKRELGTSYCSEKEVWLYVKSEE